MSKRINFKISEYIPIPKGIYTLIISKKIPQKNIDNEWEVLIKFTVFGGEYSKEFFWVLFFLYDFNFLELYYHIMRKDFQIKEKDIPMLGKKSFTKKI